MVLSGFADEKKGKLAEIKSGVDEADVLVKLAFFCLSSLLFQCARFVIHRFLLFFKIRKMDLEARSLQPSAKVACLAKLREYKSDLNQLKKEFKRVSSPDANHSAREELMESGMADPHSVNRDGYYSFFLLLVTKLRAVRHH